ncbi:MAG TPA: hypothetical protein VGT44_07420 [Ktedonobacteraceae bacterium]|nr:hypothetical protein [Ktedonobacteraceae bacterium]
MGLISNVLNQCRKPTGWFGRWLVWKMNRHHSKATGWGLQHLARERRDTILDVGWGKADSAHAPGIATQGRVYGIDFSEESMSVSCRRNKQ